MTLFMLDTSTVSYAWRGVGGVGARLALIAGRALSVGATLVTNNQRHFSKVRGLKIENWA